ncbi:netrin receptor UNC5A-like [Pollicipes pollicipes]|uniref:netrin receptor UNC5A-like n=1 Tax=Pollicipes pollicipes TaxID=41117 RepID=UPI001884FA41|nr:netrin receptor UNC5A-like [Pollicipes pollicipes]
MANYSCVAENVANRRVSPPARVTVYVNGGWSGWGAWSGCQPPCGAGRRQRHRSCDSPRPMNGGRQCRGPAQQAADCSSLCPPVDGGWSAFGDWSACDVTCRQSRQRACSAPVPAHGGVPCSGADRQHRNCSRADCEEVRAALLDRSSTDQAARAVAGRSDVALYVGLAVALLVFPMIALIALKLYRRKGRGQSMYGLTERDYEAKYYDNNKKQLSYTPDLTSNVTGATSSSRDNPHHSGSSYCSSPTSRPTSLYDAEAASCRQSLLSTPLPSSVNPDNLDFGTGQLLPSVRDTN